MSTPTELTFTDLQLANKLRGKFWCKDGQDPGTAFSGIELSGEVGELKDELDALIGHVLKLQNPLKKNIRAQLNMAGGSFDLEPTEDELADVVICCSLLANRLGTDLGSAVRRKLNKTSAKYQLPVVL